MPERYEFVDYVIELFGPFGTVVKRRMFSGHGIFLDGKMFALVAREGLWLKGDEVNRIEYEAAGCELFSYSRGGALASIGFYRAPAEALESPAAMLPWARTAYAAAQRSNAKRLVEQEARLARAEARKAAGDADHPRREGTSRGPRASRKSAEPKSRGTPAPAPSRRAPTRHRRVKVAKKTVK
jgi:DNA transformation protein and related proteins